MKYLVKARLIAGSEAGPLHNGHIKVRLFDRDFFEDEYLGEAHPNQEGIVQFEVTASDMNRGVLEDKRPDFFFVVYKNNEVVFQSKVMENIDLHSVEHYEKGKGEVIDLGSFLIDT